MTGTRARESLFPEAAFWGWKIPNLLHCPWWALIPVLLAESDATERPKHLPVKSAVKCLMRITIWPGTCLCIPERVPLSVRSAARASDKRARYAGTKSFTRKKSRTNATFVEKRSTGLPPWTLTSEFTLVTSRSSAIFVARDSTRKATTKITDSLTPAKNHSSVTSAARPSIKCTIWHFICTRTMKRSHSHARNAVKASAGILTLKSISVNCTKTKSNVTEWNNKPRVVHCPSRRGKK